MHGQVIDFCKRVKEKYPSHFEGVHVLDVGSMDVNGTNRYLFKDCCYEGVDVVAGANVNYVMPCHTMGYKTFFTTIISTEAFEHDQHLRESIKNIIDMLVPNGLFLFTCATTGRPEHGTMKRLPTDSGTSQIKGWCDYYKNVTEDMIIDLIEPAFKDYEFTTQGTDLQFYGIRR